MVRLKAIERFRVDRTAAQDRWAAARSEWRAALKDFGQTLSCEFNAASKARAAFRQALSHEIDEKRRSFVTGRQEVRLAQTSQRADFMGRLVSSVNGLVVEHCNARQTRRERARGLAAEVSQYLSNSRQIRTANSAEQASRLKLFRVGISKSTDRACTDDFLA